ncbi:MAG: CDP-alcohol phosphatidyltransferase [Bacteroidales bacterium]|jgi:phosphatidylglycerophosphate synthase|nr:CDP-alcohol phosphatidyltransferase [Bacteroidales bacterium]NLM92020.1 CDP-alcohol phosphatidyltransferase [Bacteroidales bacterium]
MKQKHKESLDDVVKSISQGRERTNFLRRYEQKALAYLVQVIPSWISSDMLTAIGLGGSVLVFLAFVLSVTVGKAWLLLGLAGFFISWFGDSLDGRIAYYRNRPRKWYGFSLDITVDWLGIILMGLGFVFYAPGWWKMIGFVFVVLYGWEMITALLRYKVTGNYSIDSGIFGPTEVRLLISAILLLEVILQGSILYTASLACLLLLIFNLIDFKKILRLADARDREEKANKTGNG